MNPWEERFPRLWAFGERLSVVFLASALFWLASFPVVTLPIALVGLFAAVAPLVRPGEWRTLARFWQGVRSAAGTALLLGLLDLVVGGVLYADIRFFWAMGSLPAKAAALFCGSLASVAAMVNTFAWPLLAWFPQPLPNLLKRAFLLTAAHPVHALAGPGAVALVAALFLVLPPTAKGLVPALGPGTAALLMGLAAWHAMRRYAKPEDETAD